MTGNTRTQCRFTLREFIGSLGDLGTLLPLVIGLIAFNGLGAVTTLALVGVTYIFTGLYYRLPVPVQPLKAAAIIAIATGASVGEIRAAALWMAAIMLFLSVTRLLDKLSEVFPHTLVQGMQLGLGLMMLRSGSQFILGYPHRLSAVVHGTHAAFLGSSGLLPTTTEFWTALVVLVLPQLPLTLGNSVLATRDCALKYFGAEGERVTPGKLAATIGVANMAAGLFGGMPVCHGAGGMTAHYHTGARSGAAGIMLGTLSVLFALIGGNSAASLISATPAWTLGLLLVYVGVRHGLLVRDAFRRPAKAAVVGAMGVTVFFGNNFLLALLVGTLVKIAVVDIPAQLRQRRIVGLTAGIPGNKEL